MRTCLLFLLLLTTIFSHSQSISEYVKDTIWLKTGIAFPCSINEELTNDQIISADFLDINDKVTSTNFPWKQVGKVHKDTRPYLPYGNYYRYELVNGTILTGRLISETDTELNIHLTDIGLLILERSKLAEMIPVTRSDKVKKSFWFANPHSTRLLFAPTAIPLRKNEGYYQNIYIVANMFNYGITNNFSIGGGFDFITMFSRFDDTWSPMLNFNVKAGFKVKEKVHAGLGIMYLTIPQQGSAGIMYGVGTLGSYNSNFTLGLGWGFTDDSFEEKPFIMVGGMARISEKLWFVSENWIAPVDDDEYYFVVSYGLRFAARRIAVDLAFINSKDIIEELVIGIPFVDFVVKLGK